MKTSEVWRTLVNAPEVLVLLGVSVVGAPVSYLGGVRSGGNALPYLYEVVFLIVYIGVVAAAFAPVRDYVRVLGRKRRTYILVWLSVMLFAQGVSDYYATFPFLPWSMYEAGGTAPDTIKVLEYFGVDSEGHEVRLNPPRLFPTNGRGYRRMANKMRQVTWRAVSPKAADRATVTQHRDELLTAVGRMHNERNPAERISAVRVYRYDVLWRVADSLIQNDRGLVADVQLK